MGGDGQARVWRKESAHQWQSDGLAECEEELMSGCMITAVLGAPVGVCCMLPLSLPSIQPSVRLQLKWFVLAFSRSHRMLP